MRLPGPRGLVWPVRTDPTGVHGPTLNQARGPGWRRTTRGRYVPASVAPSVDQRIVEVASMLPVGAAVTGWAALRWLGGIWFDGTSPGPSRPITVVSGTHDLRRQPGFVVSQEGVGPRDIDKVDGVRVTTAARSVLFEMRYAATLRAAVQVVDLACFSDLLSADELAAYVAVHTGWTGIQRARDALPLADENSWSPRETGLRLTWRLMAGLPDPLCNRPVFDLTGRHLATPDLFEPETGLAIEYDGALHLEGRRRRHDRDRTEELADHGIETLVVMAGDSEAEVADRMIRAHRRRTAWSLGPRSWTLEPPMWWAPTHTVAHRRALEPGERDAWLGHRRRIG